MNTYQLEELDKNTKLVNDLIALGFLNAKLETTDNNDQYIVTIDNIRVRPKNYQGKYMFYHVKYDIPYIDFYTKQELVKDIQAPQSVGVLSKRKVQEWIDYELKCFELCDAESKKRAEKIRDFVLRMQEVGATVRNSGFTYNIVRNGIEYEATIDSRNGYISQKVEIHYRVSNTIESFLALADNKYIQAE